MRKLIIALILLTSIGVMGQTGATRGGGGTGATTYLPKGDTTGELFYWNNTNKRMVAAFGNKLFWDATNSRLGIGTNSPSQSIEVSGSVKAATSLIAGGYVLNGSAGFYNGISSNGSIFMPVSGTGTAIVQTSGGTTKSGGYISFRIGKNSMVNEVMRVDSNLRVGIGTTAPATKLQVKDGAIRAGVTSYTEIDSTAVKAKAFTVTTTDTTSVGYSVGSIQMRITASDTSVWMLIRTTGSITARWKKLTP